MAQLKITLVKSPIGRGVKQQATVKALGLNKLGKTVVKESTPAIQGMITKVSHLVKVEEI